MSDLEKLEALLAEWGVPYKTEAGKFTLASGEQREGTSLTTGGWDDKYSPKVDGYIGFYTRFLFSADGEFVVMGAWE